MIENADRWVDAFVDAGADWVSVHVEAVPHLQRTVSHLRQRGAKAGVALNPATPLSVLDEILPELDYLLVMSVNPGFSGQRFIPGCLDKVRRARALIESRAPQVKVEVDGGVDGSNVAALVQAGADILVAGNAVYGQADPEAAARQLLQAAR
jgi:ribulose-phosphate 3-epimerase